MLVTIRLFALALLALSVVGCNRGADEATTTTAPQAVTTSTVAGGGGGGEGEVTTTTESVVTTTTVPLVVLDHEIRFRGQGTGGAILVVQVPGGQATDRALENLLLELLDEYDPVQQLDVVDDDAAVDLVRLDPEGLTEEEQAVLAAHHLARYADGRVTFEGPFSDLEGFIYAS